MGTGTFSPTMKGRMSGLGAKIYKAAVHRLKPQQILLLGEDRCVCMQRPPVAVAWLTP